MAPAAPQRPGSASEKEQVQNIVTLILGEKGMAVENGYRYSAQQHDYAQRCAAILCGYDQTTRKTAIGMLEAATGLGKTLAYLTALFAYAATTGERCAVSTHSRQLQRQMLEKDAVNVSDWIQTLTGKSLHIARRVGKKNYVSPSKVARLLSDLPQTSTKAEDSASTMRSWVVLLNTWLEDGSGVLDDFLQERGIDLPGELTRNQLTLDQYSDDDDAKAYRRDVGESKAADILIVNHSLLVLNAFRWGAILDAAGEEGRALRAVVVDEAHKLPAVAESVLSDSLSLVRFSYVSRRVADRFSERGDRNESRFWQALADKSDALKTFLQAQHEYAESRYASARAIYGIREHFQTLSETAIQASKRLMSHMRDDLLRDTQIKAHQDLLREALDHCHDAALLNKALEQKALGTPIVSWSPIKEYPSLGIGEPDAGRTLNRLWAPLSKGDNDTLNELLPPRPLLNSVVLTSATLGPPGDPLPKAFDGLSRKLGIIRHPGKDGLPVHNVQTDLMVRHAPRVFGTMHFVLPDPAIPLPTKKIVRHFKTLVETNAEWLAYSAQMLKQAASCGERVLALTLSWRDTAGLAQALRQIAPDINLIVHQRREPLKQALTLFQAHDNSVLITPAGWEGVDAPGLVKNLLIHRIPYAPPDGDADFRLRIHLRDNGYSDDAVDKIIYQHAQENVRQQLAQGLGRGIRAYDDECKVWVSDPRFPLPQHWRSSFDPILEERMTFISSRNYNRRLLDAIPARFKDSFKQASILLNDGAMYMPEDI